ncbi:mannonate dehydratase [Streptomyces sp. NPDC057582]|uniref:mannonate dehydratase n=1 Tax=Streptomyces sp. NPDC057582 TaxID=3346174 RepID=UPI0036C2231E
MIHLSELLDPGLPSDLWKLVKQCGVDDVVALLEGGEQQRSWPGQYESSSTEPWSRTGLEKVIGRFAEHGLRVIAFEDTPPMDAVRLGLPEGEEQLHRIHEQIRAMGELGVGVLCYNWMALSGWGRTDTAIPDRGGALVTGFRLADADREPPAVAPGEVTAEQLWNGLHAFLDATLPVAEEAGVKLSLHPDDPPLPAVRGIPRIVSSLDSYRRILAAHPSPSNCITFCQGNFRLMTTDLPATIREFLPHIAFVHLRDVQGTPEDFTETFHDIGPTDLAACMRIYQEGGFDGPMRPDHVPTMHGESNERPGYATLGRLFALGYIRGLQHGVGGKP